MVKHIYTSVDIGSSLIKIVVCNEEPEYKYEGYMYIVIEN